MLSLETNDRKNLSLFMMFGGALVFTIMAAFGLWWVRADKAYVFLLACIAHIQLFSIIAGFIAQLVKRRVKATKRGIEITDEGIVIPPERVEEIDRNFGKYSHRDDDFRRNNNREGNLRNVSEQEGYSDY